MDQVFKKLWQMANNLRNSHVKWIGSTKEKFKFHLKICNISVLIESRHGVLESKTILRGRIQKVKKMVIVIESGNSRFLV